MSASDLKHALRRPHSGPALAILEPMTNAAWLIHRRDPARGDAILTALCRVMDLWGNQTTLKKRNTPAANRGVSIGRRHYMQPKHLHCSAERTTRQTELQNAADRNPR